MRIRPSQPADADRLFQVWHDAVKATHHFLSAEDFAAIAGDVRTYLASASFWVADDEAGQPAAFMGMTGAHIDALFVDPARHGHGIGRALTDHARHHEEDGVLTVDVNEQNDGAVAFYERIGFVRFDRSALDDAGRPYPLLHLRRSISR
ncbi:acetyltransferase [Sphingomonas colocasiae]|uniref:Acetyltransferase n=1 Tax=Sphingomonas colocasiae TaxID=1848973 RepID=A0ABS7Q037_9SPHN|nr:acetyltransferase [Sphingomonas colocasiae]MBY8826245.1 acetyltransferase [Sphingomonas colocasiae]